MTPTDAPDRGLRRAVLIVAILNGAYFGVEFAVAVAIGSVSLLADSVDFLEDASVNLLIFFAVAWAARTRSLVGRGLAVLILVPAIATIWIAVAKILDPQPPEVGALSLAAAGALAINLLSAVLLVRHRHHAGSLPKAAWLSARNDALANVAIIAAALVTLVWSSGWPDIVVGIGIGLLNADAARAVWLAARAERPDAEGAEA
ncbi:cobalt transporter [Agromyces rhizosphaerae]|uniref:Cobalt transporter n=1 Tax=Agromyces rhizosphaerae TaxID=88374 RepID=A0A9W6D250_9MICO|nr:cation transporter [Agromyces rhizosphaerae]GLI28178.1 cobalt transporter [Agromyces rhizosphaerae]